MLFFSMLQLDQKQFVVLLVVGELETNLKVVAFEFVDDGKNVPLLLGQHWLLIFKIYGAIYQIMASHRNSKNITTTHFIISLHTTNP